MSRFLAVLMILSFLLCAKVGLAGDTFVTEEFETPGYEHPICDPNIQTSCWTEYIDTNCSIDDQYYCDDVPLNEDDNYCLYSYSNGFGELSKTTWRLDEISQENDITVMIKLLSYNLANTDQIQLIVITTDAGSKLVIIKYYYYNGQLYIGATYNEGSGNMVFTPYYEIDATEWNLIRIVYDFNSLKFRLKVNGRMKYKANLDNTYVQNPRKLDLGVCYNNGYGPAEVFISSVEWAD